MRRQTSSRSRAICSPCCDLCRCLALALVSRWHQTRGAQPRWHERAVWPAKLGIAEEMVSRPAEVHAAAKQLQPRHQRLVGNKTIGCGDKSHVIMPHQCAATQAAAIRSIFSRTETLSWLSRELIDFPTTHVHVRTEGSWWASLMTTVAAAQAGRRFASGAVAWLGHGEGVPQTTRRPGPRQQ